MSNTTTGSVKWFNEAKGFGFIEQESGRRRFCSLSVLLLGDGFKTLAEGQRVQFTVTRWSKRPTS